MRFRWWIAAACVAAAVAAGTIVFALQEEDDDDPSAASTRPAAETTEADPEPASPASRAPETLPLPDQGHPLVCVRKGRQVEIRSAPGGPVVRRVGRETEFGSVRVFSVQRREGEWAGVPTPFTGNGRLGWVRLDPRALKAGYTTSSLVVDLSDHRATLYREGEKLRSFTVTVGRPDAPTPTGRFAVTDTFRGGLNPAYGCCAVALTAEQPQLPSGWLGGNRIAFHGTTGPLGQNLSNGCIRAADRDVSALVELVPPGAPVTVRQ